MRMSILVVLVALSWGRFCLQTGQLTAQLAVSPAPAGSLSSAGLRPWAGPDGSIGTTPMWRNLYRLRHTKARARRSVTARQLALRGAAARLGRSDGTIVRPESGSVERPESDESSGAASTRVVTAQE